MDTDGHPIAVPRYDTFEEAAKELRFAPFLQAALVRNGFFHLTPIQQCSMQLLQNGRDFMASAFTGSGKTAAYLLPILSSLHQMSRLLPGTLVASHYKAAGNKRSEQPLLGKIRGIKRGLAAIEFSQATGLVHRQLIPPDWIVGAPEPPARRSWTGPATPTAVVLVPTRELSEQVHKEAEKFLYYSNLKSASLYSGSQFKTQLRDLAHGADVLVATPGCLVDALHKGMLKLEKVKYLVMDEVDRMMELGFGSQLEEVIKQGDMPTTKGGRQTSFWSATLPMPVRELVEAFLGQHCVWVDCTGGQTNAVPNTIDHIMIDARPPHRVLRAFQPGDKVITKRGRRGIVEFPVGKSWRVEFTDGELVENIMFKKGQISLVNTKTENVRGDRLQQLQEILISQELRDASVMIFCGKRDSAMEVYEYLKPSLGGVVTVHGGMSQSFRSKSVEAFRTGKADVLIATDVAARGIDIPNVTHIINFELPQDIDEFVHRCGRTGRIGRKGTAVTFVTGREKIFPVIKRVLREQGHWLPPWFSYEGLQLAWRPRGYRMPFYPRRKAKYGKDASVEERLQALQKARDRQRRIHARVMERAALREGAPLPRRRNRDEDEDGDYNGDVGDDDVRQPEISGDDEGEDQEDWPVEEESIDITHMFAKQ
eukprot:TRINITY_DN108934_c0_g1_i1.p1 TRINITY_DN108934_c0_g1~~TRINITY_DN108934_c0_g1_i1.p1  ORF type:complete len:702 (+),score=130.18 TRINITY_DN108934_c0_g1_i1:153-2108(+)